MFAVIPECKFLLQVLAGKITGSAAHNLARILRGAIEISKILFC